MKLTFNQLNTAPVGTIVWLASAYGVHPCKICRLITPGCGEDNVVVYAEQAPSDCLIYPETTPKPMKADARRYWYGDEEFFDNREEAENHHNKLSQALSRAQAEEREREQKRKARAKMLRALHDKLYAEALSLAVDADDLDVVEHYCQGNISRLRKFIASRKKQQLPSDTE